MSAPDPPLAAAPEPRMTGAVSSARDHLEMLALLAFFRALGAAPLPRRLAWMDRLAAHLPSLTSALPDGRAMQLAGRCSRLVPGALCLHRVLAAKTWLARRGRSADLVLGVRPGVVEADGHAWLERDGVPLEAVDEASFAFVVRERTMRVTMAGQR
jgi:hypothetical protein